MNSTAAWPMRLNATETVASREDDSTLEMNEESDSEDEQIFVTRKEEERDPEAEADFDREFEKMMAESMDSRRFERKAVFDIPLPIQKRSTRENAPAEPAAEEEPVAEEPAAPKTMTFSLITKKGNKQQVRSK